MALSSQDKDADVVVLSRATTRMLFGAICTDESLFRRAREAIGGKFFGELGRMYAFVLDVMVEYWDQYKSMPHLDVLRSNIQADLSEDFETDQEDIDECSEVLAMAAAIADMSEAKRKKYVDASHRSLDTFIQEVHRLDILSKISKGDLSIMLSESQQTLRQAMSTNSDRFASPFLEMLDNRPAGRFTSVGNRLVDSFVGGTGPATGDIVLHAAARGSGKSQLCNATANDVAAHERANAKREKRKPRFVYVLTYESLRDTMTHMLSYGAKIPRNTIEEFLTHKDPPNAHMVFSRSMEYKPYELQTFAKMIRQAKSGNGPFPLTEWERLQQARKKLSANIMIADFTGSRPDFKSMSEDFVPGIVEFIESHQLSVGNVGVEGLFVDYAGTCVKAHMRKPGRKNQHGDNAERKLIENLPFDLKNLIANPMSCFVWLVHQLAAAEADKQGGTRANPNAFKDCKSIAENVDHAFVNGKPTKEQGLAIFSQSKSRRDVEKDDQIAQLVGNYCHWKAVESGYSIANGQIVDSEQAAYIGGGDSFIAPDE